MLSALLRYTESDYPFGECTSPWMGLELTTACLRKKLPFYAVKATLNYMYNVENNIVLYSSRYTYICSKKCCILGPSWSWSYCSWIYNYLCNQWITTKIVTSNPDHGEVYSIQYYFDEVWQWLATGRWFSRGTPVSSTNKTNRHDIAEILLKVTLNTINLNIIYYMIYYVCDVQRRKKTDHI